MDLLMEQPPMVLAGAALGVVLLVAFAFNSHQQQSATKSKQLVSEDGVVAGDKPKASKMKKGKKAGAKVEEVKEPVVAPKKVEPPAPPKEEPAPAPAAAGGGKKKKKKKAAAKAPEPEPESEPEPEPQPDPEPEHEPEHEPEPVVSEKKKKKKKKKKSGVTTEAEPVAAKPKSKAALSADEDDEDSDDDHDVSLLLKSRKPKPAAAPTNGASKKKPDVPKKAPEPVPPKPVDPNAVHTITLSIETEEKPVLVGPKGVTIQGIQFDSNSRLDIDGNVLKITGTESAIAIAMEHVQKILTEYREEKRRLTASTTTLSGKEINGSDGIKAIIGKGGTTIQNIQTQTGCKLDANVEKGIVVITGPSDEKVSQAATLCKHAVFGESQHGIDLKNVGTVMLVYGKDFSKIRQMQTDSGAKLDIAKGSTRLEISGPTEAVAKARQMVEEWIEYCKGEVLMVEASKVGVVYGKGGATVRRIQERTGAFVQVDDQGKKGNEMVPCQILGEPDVVAQAKDLILKALDGDVELKPGEIQEKMDLDVGAPAVIGRGGTKIRELESTFGIRLVVNGNMCTIAGKKESVLKAKSEIEKIIKPLLEEKRIALEAERLSAEAQNGADPGPWGGNFDDGAEGW